MQQSYNSQSKNDPFNWNFPQRCDLMSQSACNNGDVIGYKQRGLTISQDHKYIDKPQATYYNKISYQNRCDDIQGTKPNILLQNRPIRRLNYSMKIDDIEGVIIDIISQGTKSQINKFQTLRFTNPLQPQYKLATAIAILNVQDPQKYIRNTLDISDIDGSKAKKDPWYNKIRNIDPYTVIEGTQTKQFVQIRDTIDTLNVQDINNKIQSKAKNTNPLSPIYQWNMEKFVIYGFIEGSKSTLQHPDMKKEKSISLNTDQIQGCKADTLRQDFYLRGVRRHYQEANKVSDIPGAQVGSLQNGIRTNRHINPITPVYNLPGQYI